MKLSRRVANRRSSWCLRAAAVVVALMHATSAVPLAQNTPPRGGTPSGVDVSNGFYDAAGALVGATVAGARAVGRATKDLFTPGGPIEGLEGLREGTAVVVTFPENTAPAALSSGSSADGPTLVEGIVSRVDRGRKEVTVRFGTRTRETFQLIDFAAAAAQGSTSPDPSAITIDFTDESGQRIARSFRRKP